jgi:hypothetical protein
MATANMASIASPAPNLTPLAKAQNAAARFYVILTFINVVSGLSLLAMPLVLPITQEEVKAILRIGGGFVVALGAFPSTKYLQRRDRVFALQMISLEYERLQIAGLLGSPARKALDKIIARLIEGMIK